TCPACGGETQEGRKYIDGYQIIQVLHEGFSSTLCKCRKVGEEEFVMIRIFTAQSGVDEKIAGRLKQELEELKKLPDDYFIQHFDIRKSYDGAWYRISEWVETENWGSLLTSQQLQDYGVAFKLFHKIASILDGLHRIGHFMPYLILDDILVIKDEQEVFDVKIDYKLSRFLDPQASRPGPMLRRLMGSHPDIVNQRPLDFRSDIWSLGKIFIELLTANFESQEFLTRIDEISLPKEIALLIKFMLAEDPDLRPQSMAEVAETLSKVKNEEIEAAKHKLRESAPAPVKQVRRLRKRMSLLIAMVAAIGVLLAGIGWYYFSLEKKDSETTLIGYANEYAGSVAFIVSNYQLFDGENMVYQNRTEGSAFLIDKEGFLLTNRHVACPWLEDQNLFMMINMLRQNQGNLRFAYQLFLWFEGEKAFNRLPGMTGSIEMEDFYTLDSAFSTEGAQSLAISGVGKAPGKTWQLVNSPLKNDFAVLKIDRIPESLEPIPLDLEMDPMQIPRLSSVITLGFPLGSQTQAKTVNVSVTQGHVRRTFENMLHVDTSIHSGNSGGPVIDINGKVIGIASSVAIGRALGPVPVSTPLSDIGMILPITKTVNFIQELKAGEIKWKGILDPSLGTKLKQITDLAKKGQWKKAKKLADEKLGLSPDPTLVLATGIMNFCADDKDTARKLFVQALSMDNENTLAKLMLYTIDWLNEKSGTSTYRKELVALDWRSSNEFLGHLVKVLEGLVDEKSALNGGYSRGEKSWLNYVVGLMHLKKGNLAYSEKLFKKAVVLSDINDWLFFLAYAELGEVQKRRLKELKKESERIKYVAANELFIEKTEIEFDKKTVESSKLLTLISRFRRENVSLEGKQDILKELLKYNSGNGKILKNLAFYHAMNEEWDPALQYSRTYLETRGRESSGWLSVRLLKAGILHNIGREEEAKTDLEAFNRNIKDPWYRLIGKQLLDPQDPQSLSKKAEENLEYLVTWHTALGFWAEGAGRKKEALEHYKEALGSYMDTRIEYDFARMRIQKLKKSSG
ncbi:MAG: trypsin-like serine protease, partial [Proteobacteria bacterium]|nr:trypsin-like serine protease [Pseudomonadota bacterium]